MKPRTIQWVAAGVLLTACVTFIANRGGSSPAVSNAFRPPDAAPQDPAKIPHVLKLTPSILDFGEIVLGENKVLSVEVQNTGKRPVTVYRTVFTCTCLSGGMETETIAPGQSGKLKITFAGLPGKRSYHTVASIISDEQGPCRYDVTVDGRIQQDFIAEPETLQFGELKKDGTGKIETIIRRRDGKPFTIKEIKSPRAEFSFVSELAPGPKDTAYKIIVTAKALRPGSVTDSAAILTGEYSPDVSPVLTLSMEVQGDFLCTPPIAIVGMGADGKPVPFETSIQSRAGGKIHVDAVAEGQERKMEFSQEAQGDGSCRLKLWFKSEFPSGAPFGEFLITVAGQGEPVHLPYRIELSPSKQPSNP